MQAFVLAAAWLGWFYAERGWAGWGAGYGGCGVFPAAPDRAAAVAQPWGAAGAGVKAAW